MRRFLTSKNGWILTCVFLFLLFFLMNYFTPLVADDYGTMMHHKFGTHEPIASLSDALESARLFYMGWGGRLSCHLLTIGVSFLPPVLFDVANTIAYLCMTWLIYRICSPGKKHILSLFLGIHILLWLCVPDYGMVVLTLFLLYFRKTGIKLRLPVLAGYIGSLLGFSVLILAPGIYYGELALSSTGTARKIICIAAVGFSLICMTGMLDTILYSREIKVQTAQREAYILEQKEKGNMDIRVPIISHKYPLRAKHDALTGLSDIQEDPSYWINESLAYYYGVHSITGYSQPGNALQ